MQMPAAIDAIDRTPIDLHFNIWNTIAFKLTNRTCPISRTLPTNVSFVAINPRVCKSALPR